MCRICVEWELGKMTSKEAMRALGEVISVADEKERKHLLELSDKILDKEVPMEDTDLEMDRLWSKEKYGK